MGALDMKTELANPRDVTYQLYRKKKVRELLKSYSQAELQEMLRYQQRQPGPRDESGEVTKQIYGDLLTTPQTPDAVKNILGTGTATGSTDGSPLIRQDLDPIITALFVQEFPAFESLTKEESNGLVFAFDQFTTPDPSTTSTSNTISTVVNDLGTVGFTASTPVRQTANISVFAIGRGVSFKEMAAVSAGGMAWNPEKLELGNGMVKLAYDVETMILQGNGTYAAGTASNEGGLYSNNPLYFDGLRQILGSVAGSNYAGNNAVQAEAGTLSLTQSIKSAAAKMAQNGGRPDFAFLTINAKEVLDQENEGNKRYDGASVEIVPGVQVQQLAYANGYIKLIPVPGYAFGTYTSPLTSNTVEDVYIIDSRHLVMPWLFSEGFTVLELPAALDYTLSQRYIVFGMYGLAVKAPLFCGKVRKLP